MYATTYDYVPQQHSTELCWGNMRLIQEIGGHGCKLCPNPGAKVPLLDKLSVTSCRQFNNKPNLDFVQNKVLAKDFAAPKNPGNADVKLKKASSYQATFQKLSTKQIRGAKQQSMGDNDPLKTDPGITGGKTVVDRSYAASQYFDKTGLLGLPKKVLPVNQLDTNAKKPDFWVSENNREYRSYAPDKKKTSRRQRVQEIDNLLNGLRPKQCLGATQPPGFGTPSSLSKSSSMPDAALRATH